MDYKMKGVGVRGDTGGVKYRLEVSKAGRCVYVF